MITVIFFTLTVLLGIAFYIALTSQTKRSINEEIEELKREEEAQRNRNKEYRESLKGQ